MNNHFHLVIETPQANLVALSADRQAGMKWFLGAYTSRFNSDFVASGPAAQALWAPLQWTLQSPDRGWHHPRLPAHPRRIRPSQPGAGEASSARRTVALLPLEQFSALPA